MKDIKFRAWRKTDREWDDNPSALHISTIGTANHLEFNQYTGLKDKNGKEIYEGDIVKTTRKMVSGKIKYEVPSRVVEWIKSKSFIGFNIGIGIDEYRKKSIRRLEVIGNIYENPELAPELTDQEEQK